ncbi:uncharacterized protein [Halyomorpha halys]|uniref:uncharacterized protein n=1 Tax=Halyomorpha halys TaxID=286706 RepID=UPI0006D50651|nr:uncharacterized protein LOC106683974 [Halyomorpha halys]
MGALISKLSRLSVDDEKIENVKPIDNYLCPDEQNLKTPKGRFIADNILDPRSATVGIRRTPLVLVKVGVETPVKPKLYLETDLDEMNKSDNNSCISEFEDSNSSEHSLDIEEGLEAFDNDAPLSEFGVEDIVEEKINPSIEFDIVNVPSSLVKKTYIYEDVDQTPESTPVKPKGGRTPLSVVSTNNSPLPSPLGKPWRGIREERLRLGLENTPPPSQEPYPDVVQSAPGKVGIKRTAKKSWARAHWALDESVVI